MGLNHSPRIVTDGLVLCLDAANRKSYPGSGTTWFDLSGNARNGAFTNGATFDSGNAGSLSFDGTDDCIVLNNDVLINTAAPFTVYIWMNHNPRTSGTLFHRIATLRSSASQPLGIAFLNGNSNGYNGLYLTAAADWVKGSNGYFPATNTWGLLALSYNGAGSTTGTNFKMYWNGVDIGFTANPSATSVSITNASFIAGRRSTSDDQYYRGKISNFMLYDKEHTSSQVLANYSALRGRYGI
jgi:hypothetical protein